MPAGSDLFLEELQRATAAGGEWASLAAFAGEPAAALAEELAESRGEEVARRAVAECMWVTQDDGHKFFADVIRENGGTPALWWELYNAMYERYVAFRAEGGTGT